MTIHDDERANVSRASTRASPPAPVRLALPQAEWPPGEPEDALAPLLRLVESQLFDDIRARDVVEVGREVRLGNHTVVAFLETTDATSRHAFAEALRAALRVRHRWSV